MTTFPGSPRLMKGGIVLVDSDSGAVQRVITLQYNPDTVTRSLQISSPATDRRNRSEALRAKGPPVETISLEAEIDATDQLEDPDNNPDTVEHGIAPQLAALETIVYPSSASLQANNALSLAGILELIPMELSLSIFVWSKNRVLPFRLTECSITENAFDPNLNPIRATVSLGMRVLSIDDLGFSHRGGSTYMSYLRVKESLAAKSAGGSLNLMGIQGML